MTKSIVRIHVLPSVLFLILFASLIANSSFAETKTFIKEYIYQASESDSKLSCRTIALREVKRLILEELGTYLESTTEVQNNKLTKDQITTLTAGIVQTELVDEKWSTETLKYWLKAKITLDSGEVIKAIDELRKNHEKTKELCALRKRSDALLKENERLRKILTTTTGEKKQKDIAAYNKTIKELNATEWFERGYALFTSGIYYDGKHETELHVFTKAIEIEPTYVMAYYYRAHVYNALMNYEMAIRDLDIAIELDPKYSDAYYWRAHTYKSLGSYQQAIRDFDKAIELNPKRYTAYHDRGFLYGRFFNSYYQAIRDFDKAIELEPKYQVAYDDRAFAFKILGDYQRAINDFDKSIELSSHPLTYLARGLAYHKLGNYRWAIRDYNKVMELESGFARFADIYVCVGAAYAELRDSGQAIKNYEKAVKLDPKYSQTYTNQESASGSLEYKRKILDDIKSAGKLASKAVEDYLKSQGIGW